MVLNDSGDYPLTEKAGINFSASIALLNSGPIKTGDLRPPSWWTESVELCDQRWKNFFASHIFFYPAIGIIT